METELLHEKLLCLYQLTAGAELARLLDRGHHRVDVNRARRSGKVTIGMERVVKEVADVPKPPAATTATMTILSIRILLGGGSSAALYIQLKKDAQPKDAVR